MSRKSLIVLALLLALSIAGWWLSGKPLQNYLSLHAPKDQADILITEGWLDNHELDYVARLFSQDHYKYLITTGFPVNKDFLMPKIGTYRIQVNEPPSSDGQISLRICLRGTLPYPHASAFRIFIDSKQIAFDSVGTRPKTLIYTLNWPDSTGCISVKFINDAIIEGKDRNLLISKVSLNNRSYFPYNSDAAYQVQTVDDSTIYDLAENQALLSRNLLIRKGIPAQNIIAVSGKKTGFSKTLAAAKNTILAIDSLQQTQSYNFNIVSSPPHTRRTFAAYKKFHSGDTMGIIAIPVSYIKDYQVNRINNLREFLGILFVRIYPFS